MDDPILLRAASVQDIQLELLRRTRFNALDGETVCDSLRNHRHLWLAALLDRPGVPNYAEAGLLLISGLIKLRDLPDNIWNADTLYVLTPTRHEADALARIAEEVEWGGEAHVYARSERDRHGAQCRPAKLRVAVRVVGLKPSLWGDADEDGEEKRCCCLSYQRSVTHASLRLAAGGGIMAPRKPLLGLTAEEVMDRVITTVSEGMTLRDAAHVLRRAGAGVPRWWTTPAAASA